MEKKITELLANIKQLKESNAENCRLPENVFYLEGGDILCMEREYILY